MPELKAKNDATTCLCLAMLLERCCVNQNCSTVAAAWMTGGLAITCVTDGCQTTLRHSMVNGRHIVGINFVVKQICLMWLLEAFIMLCTVYCMAQTVPLWSIEGTYKAPRIV